MKQIYTAIFLAITLTITACTPSGVIPKHKMAVVFHDMYLLDAWTSEFPDVRAMADTSAVYASVLEKYGYTVDKFNNSISYYLNHTSDFDEILKEVLQMYDSEINADSEATSDESSNSES